MGRESCLKQSLGTCYSKVKQARVLMVGAGGIGCELLKDLVLSGFGEIHVVDLDTIDLSNLNRQFLFGHEHIKKSKALVAKESAARFNPAVKIEAYHANIKDPQFNVDWFKSFRIVFNALDNIDARRHVNKMCIAAAVPLIDSGTTGFNGHVAIIEKGLTKCYDCVPPVAPKSFPVCTIRNTPSEPIHCIVWAKSYLFPELFGVGEEAVAEVNWSEQDAANSREDIEKLRKESAELSNIRASMHMDDFVENVFDKVFTRDIQSMSLEGEAWKKRKPPEPLDYAQLSKGAETVPSIIASNDQVIWSATESFAVFKNSLQRLSTEMQRLKSSSAPIGDTEPILTFDKDDDDTLDFVAAAANLRAQIFGVETKSKFDTKQIAGNIIPAIATTNAMIGGLTVLAAFKVLRGDTSKAKLIHLQPNHTERVFAAENPFQPNPYCPVCTASYSTLETDLDSTTLGEVIDLLKQKFAYGDEIAINLDGHGLLYDIDEDIHLQKKLAELGIENASFLTVTDESDEPRVDLKLAIVAPKHPEDHTKLHFRHIPELPPKVKGGETPLATNGATVSQSDPLAIGAVSELKRKRAPEDNEEIRHLKKGKVITGQELDVIVLNDEDAAGDISGAIVLD